MLKSLLENHAFTLFSDLKGNQVAQSCNSWGLWSDAIYAKYYSSVNIWVVIYMVVAIVPFTSFWEMFILIWLIC